MGDAADELEFWEEERRFERFSEQQERLKAREIEKKKALRKLRKAGIKFDWKPKQIEQNKTQ